MQWLVFFGRFLLLDVTTSVVTFPLWWYGDGLTSVIRWSGRSLRYRWRSYAFDVWLRSMFVPMYGQADLFGRAISVVMRFVVLAWRLVGYGIEALLHGLLIVAWTAWPILLFLLLVLAVYQSLFGALAA
jgi:hypothetical protein